MSDVTISLIRDSIDRADDVSAPNEGTITVAADLDLAGIASALLGSGYLPTAPEGGCWSIWGVHKPLAVLREFWTGTPLRHELDFRPLPRAMGLTAASLPELSLGYDWPTTLEEMIAKLAASSADATSNFGSS